VLQSCTDPLEVLPGPSTETFPASDGACNFSNTEVEEDVTVLEEGFIDTNEEVAERIKQEEIAENICFPDIKSEPDEVSYVYVCLFSDPFYVCAEISVVFVISLLITKQLHCYERK
jgi:hypothetical protein